LDFKDRCEIVLHAGFFIVLLFISLLAFMLFLKGCKETNQRKGSLSLGLPAANCPVLFTKYRRLGSRWRSAESFNCILLCCSAARYGDYKK
jgi:hypothetical protein